MISPTTRANALGERFRNGVALGSAKATSGRDRSSGIASDTKPWRVAPPKMNAVPKTAAVSQNTRSLRNRQLFPSDCTPRLTSIIRHPHDKERFSRSCLRRWQETKDTERERNPTDQRKTRGRRCASRAPSCEPCTRADKAIPSKLRTQLTASIVRTIRRLLSI